MLKQFYPNGYVDNVFVIDYEQLFQKGYRGLIFDIDNTLVHHGDDSTLEIDNLFKELHSLGFQTLLLTNNDEDRVRRFIKNIDTLYICDAGKPAAHSYIKAVEMLKMEKEEVICIGDQIFTDILGANRCSIASILVKFIRLKEETKIGKKRHLENIILKLYQLNNPYRQRWGNICKKG